METRFKIPLCKSEFSRRTLFNIRDALVNNQLGGRSNKNLEFEKNAERYFGQPTVSVNSCTSALLAALMVLDFEEGSEIILPSFSFSATANAVIWADCIPVFADILPLSFTIDPESIISKITTKTKAIIAVHFAGYPCLMNEIMEIANEFNLKVIEDCAEAMGSRYNGNPVGTIGDAGCFSLFATKNITTGEGGLLTFKNPDDIKKALLFIDNGVVRENNKRDCVWTSLNFKMSGILAAVAIDQLSSLDNFNLKRRSIANKYISKLMLEDVLLQPRDQFHTYQMFVIKFKTKEKRDHVLNYLRLRSIEASIHFDPPIHLQTAYIEDYETKSLPVTEDVSNTILTLPLYPSMTSDESDFVIEQTIKAIHDKDS